MVRHFVSKAQSFIAIFAAINFVSAASAQSQGSMHPHGKQFTAYVSVDADNQVHSHQNRANRNANKRRESHPLLTQPIFQTAVGYGSGGQLASAVAVADLNADGKPDLVVANGYDGGAIPGNGGVGVLLGNGDGTFQPATTYDSGGEGSFGNSVSIADVNHDGKPDLIVVNSCGDSYCTEGTSVAVFIGNGDGTFQTAVKYLSGGSANSATVGDVNGDGKPDLVVANGDGSVGVLLGKGDGTFGTAQTYSLDGDGAYSVAIADVNGDGHPDLVATTICCGVGIFLGKGDGTFQPVVTYPSGGEAYSVAIGDVNGDGKRDLVVANGGSDTVGVFLGNGDGTFQPVVTYPTVSGNSGYAISIALADVNADGKLDMVVTTGDYTTTGNATVFLGNGDGTFQPAINFSTLQFAAVSVAVADVNGDGTPDLLVVNDCDSTRCGDGTAGSVAVLLNETSPRNSTSTAVASSLNPSAYGQLVTFTATVHSASGTPTGSVIFYDGTTSIGSASLSHGTASLPTSTLFAASHLITAAYQGSSSFAPSASTVLTQVVTGTATTTSVLSELNPAVYGQSVTLSATVSSSAGTPTGTVIFYDSSTEVGSATLASGNAVVSVTSLPVGSDSVTAIYQGFDGFVSSTSAPLTEVVTTATSTTALAASPNPGVPHQPVNYTATITSQYGQKATGTVTFQDNGATVATVNVSGNQAVYSIVYKKRGNHSVIATYSGDADNEGSTSQTLTEVILRAEKPPYTTSTSLSASGSFVLGQTVTFYAAIHSDYGHIPDGDSVKFFEGARTIGFGTTVGGVASITDTLEHSGLIDFQADYEGDPMFKGSFRDLKEFVNKNPTTTTLVSSLNPAVYGQPITYTATVTSSGPAPTGFVKITNIGQVPLVNGVATVTKNLVTVGTHALTAEYLGDSQSAQSTSPVLNQVVNPAPTTTALTSSANPSSSGQSVTFIATVTSSSGVNPTGMVTFTAGGVTLGTVNLKNTVAKISTATLPVGSTTITATYGGAASFTGSSASLTQVVNP